MWPRTSGRACVLPFVIRGLRDVAVELIGRPRAEGNGMGHRAVQRRQSARGVILVVLLPLLVASHEGSSPRPAAGTITRVADALAVTGVEVGSDWRLIQSHPKRVRIVPWDADSNTCEWHHHPYNGTETGNCVLEAEWGRSWPSGDTGDGGPVQDAGFMNVTDVGVDGSGAIYLSSQGNREGNTARVRRIDPATDVITTVVGGGLEPVPGQPGGSALGSAVAFDYIYDVDVAYGRTYFSGRGGNYKDAPGIFELDDDGRITRLTSSGTEFEVGADGSLYWLEGSHQNRMTRLWQRRPDGTHRLLAGGGGQVWPVTGMEGTAVDLRVPSSVWRGAGLAVDEVGNVFVVHEHAEAPDWTPYVWILRIDPVGRVSVVAGGEAIDYQYGLCRGPEYGGDLQAPCDNGDGGPATDAHFLWDPGIPSLKIHPDGHLLVVDKGGVRMIWGVANLLDDEPPRWVTAPALSPADPEDALLVRGIALDAVDDGAGVSHYEWRWVSPSAAAPQPAAILPVSGPHVIDFTATTPLELWHLEVRAIDLYGNATDWTQAWSGVTPSAPLLLALGDSVTSGHHREAGENFATCNDPEYGYPSEVRDHLLAELPSAWKPTYVNLARSGFATGPRFPYDASSDPEGSVLTGGPDACGSLYEAPIDAATKRLRERAQAGDDPGWNRVVMSAGANDTNWADVIEGMVKAFVVPVTSETGDYLRCESHVAEWNGTNPSVQDRIAANVATILARLRQADPSVSIRWIGYANIADTGDIPQMARERVIPAACQVPVGRALSLLESVIAPVVEEAGAYYVDIDPTVGMRNELLQPIWFNDNCAPGFCFIHEHPDGWPHPSRTGAAVIARLVPL